MCADDPKPADAGADTKPELAPELDRRGELEHTRAKLAELERDELARTAPVRIANALERIACSNATLAAEAQRQSWSLERSEALERACVAVAVAVAAFLVGRAIAARYFT